MSTKWINKSADLRSSKVVLNDSINSVGISEIKPTVSVNKIALLPGLKFFLVTESKVANN